MPRGPKVQPKDSDWPPEQTLRVLKQQHQKLEALRGRSYDEANGDETVWKQITEGAMIHGFGEASHNVSNFYMARSAGVHNIMGISRHQRQLNFEERIEKSDATVRASIAELEAAIPEAEIKGAYDAGDEYAFYKDLKDMLVQAKAEIFIVDNYLNTEFFDLYVAVVKPGIGLRIMTDQLKGNLEAVARKYAGSHSIELRSSPDVHDRHIFVDDRGWSVGQSIKDAAKKKPTYMVELSAGLVPVIRKIYEDIWAKAVVLRKKSKISTQLRCHNVTSAQDPAPHGFLRTTGEGFRGHFPQHPYLLERAGQKACVATAFLVQCANRKLLARAII